jgi:hypothetical protein
MLYRPKTTTFCDIRGNLRYLYPLSINNRAIFRQRLMDLDQYVTNGEFGEILISNILEQDPIFRQYIDACLAVFGLSTEDLPIEGVIEFLFPHVDAQGNEHDSGLLVELNFPPVQKSDETLEFDQGFYETLASLWGAQEDLESAIRLMDQLTPEMFAELAKVKTKQDRLRDPKVRAQEKTKEKIKKRLEKKTSVADFQDFLNKAKNDSSSS